MYRNLYNELDTKSKRCLIIDIYSILFIIVPTRYFLTKKRGPLWIIALLFLLGKVKGKEEVLLRFWNASEVLPRIYDGSSIRGRCCLA